MGTQATMMNRLMAECLFRQRDNGLKEPDLRIHYCANCQARGYNNGHTIVYECGKVEGQVDCRRRK